MHLRRSPAPRTARTALAALHERVSPAHLAVVRTGAGAVMIVRPTVLPRLLGVDSATATRVGWSVQMLGVREIALGVGTLVALRRADVAAARLWVAVGVLTDAVDALAVGGALARGRLRSSTGLAVVVTAAAAAALGARALGEDGPGEDRPGA